MATLADRLNAALERWECWVDGSELRGGMSVVVPVRSVSGFPFMLKLLDPDAASQEAIALSAFPPSASVCCHGHADDLGALLLEKLTSESLADTDPHEMITVQAQLARNLAAPDPGGIEKLSDNARWLDHLEYLRRLCPGLLSNRATDAARETIADLGREPATTLTHGDLHSINVHKDTAGHWRALDPKPRVGTVAYESHTVIVERAHLDTLIQAGSNELHRRLELFSDVAAVDLSWAERLCQARAVSSALYEHTRNAALAEKLCWMSELLAR